MATQTSSPLSGLEMVNPHRPGGSGSLGRAYRQVASGGTRSLPGTSEALPVSIAGAGRMWDLDGWNRATHATSLLVVVAGEVVHEWYADGVGAEDLFLGASMTKSALAHLVGMAVGGGSLSVQDRVVDHVPELSDSGYAACTVLDVLTMTSGVDWVEDYRDAETTAVRLLGCFAGPGGSSRSLLATIGPADHPGTRFQYCTADSQVLDWVRERATGTAYDVAIGDLWKAVGATSGAVVGVDGEGTALAGGGLAATARDWARVGLLQLDGTVGGNGGARLLDPAWVELTCVPSQPFLRPGCLPSSITTHAGFGGHWWPTDDRGRRVTADGSRGQFAYVDRDLGVVAVKTSRWPYEDLLVDRQCRDLSYLGLAEIVKAASARRLNQPNATEAPR